MPSIDTADRSAVLATRPESVVHVSQPVTEGVANVALSMSVAQRASGLDVTLVCPEGPLGERAERAGVPVVMWQATRSPGPRVAAETRALRRILDDINPDVVHLHSSKAGLAGRLALRGSRPTVFQPHAWSFQAVTGPVRKATIGWERAAARWTDLLVCCSIEEQTIGTLRGVRAPSRVIPNTIDLDRFHPPATDERSEARARLGLHPDAPVVLCVGRLSHQKGQDLAIRAWAAVRAQVPGATLLLVGEGPAEDELKAQAAGVDGIVFLGNRADVDILLSASDLVVMPSRWEGMPLALLEAMASGRPVVATDVEGMASSLTSPGMPAAGVIVPSESPGAIASAVASELQQPHRRIVEGAAGRLRTEMLHSADRHEAAVFSAYAAAIGNARGRGRKGRLQLP